MPNRFSLHESDYRGRGRCRRDSVSYDCCRAALIVEKDYDFTSGLDDVAVIDHVDNSLGAQERVSIANRDFRPGPITNKPYELGSIP